MAGPFSLVDGGAETSAEAARGKPLMIVQMAQADQIGLGEDSARALAKATIAAGGRTALAGAGAAAPRLAVTGVDLLPFSLDGRRARRAAAGALAAALDGQDVDLIHAHDAVSAEIGGLTAAMIGARLVTSLHRRVKTGVFARGDRPLLRGERIFAASGVIAESASKGLMGAMDRVAVIPAGVDMDVFAEEVVPPTRTIRTAEEWGLAEDTRPLILAPEPIGSDTDAKTLIEAMARLRDGGAADALCLLVSAEPAPKAEQAILARGLVGHVRIAAPSPDLPAALKLSAVIVSTAAAPPATGAYLIEAQAMGRPVIAPNHGAAAEAVEDGATGWLTPPGDPAALADALAEALSLDESQLAHIGLAGRARVRSRFTLAASLAATLAIYEEVAGRPMTLPQ